MFNKYFQSKSKEISPEDAKKNLENDKDIIVIDVREPHEFKAGHIEGAKNIPLAKINEAIETVCPKKDQTIYIYCRSGQRSDRACKMITDEGYENSYNLGGIISWPYEII
ncbi:MAG: rhodanese-like domain-containing protein [Cellulosilyticaceae bacterium]